MRTITKYSTHIYTTKASAMRAVRNLIGSSFTVNAPELENRFFGRIIVTAEMIGVEPHGEGWHWLYAFDLADVMVEILRKPLGEGDVPETIRYADVAHWQNARTPSIEEVVPSQTLEQLDLQVKAYMSKVDGPSDNRFFNERWRLCALCRQVGTTLEAMLRRLGFFDVTPVTPAPEPTPAAPTTLPELAERVDQYWAIVSRLVSAGRDADAEAYSEREEPPLREVCNMLGVKFSDVTVALIDVGLAVKSDNPVWMAIIMLEVAPFGLDTRIQGRLEDQARERGVPVSEYMQLAAEKLHRRAA